MAAFTSVATGNWNDVDTWRAVSAWAATTDYAVGNFVKPTSENGYVYEVTTDAGSSGGSEPSWPTTIGNTVVDDGITWTCRAGHPGQEAAGDTVVIADASTPVTLTADPAYSLASITNSGNAGYVDISGTRTLTLTGNPGISYTGTIGSSGFIRVGASANLTVTHNQGSGTVAVNQSGTGATIVTSSDGVLTISNTGGTAVKHTSGTSQATVVHGSTGLLTINGNVQGGSRSAISITNSSATVTINGDVLPCSTFSYASLATTTSPTITINGNISGPHNDGFCIATNGTVYWTGNRTVAAGELCYVRHGTGNFIMATADDHLVLTNRGTIIFYLASSGSFDTADAGDGAARIINAVAPSATGGSFAAFQKGTDANRGIIEGPTIPAEEDVEASVEYGYAGDLQTGTLAAGGGGLLQGNKRAHKQ